MRLWHSNYGRASDGAFKPELVAPSIWVVAPLLPESEVAQEAKKLFAERAKTRVNGYMSPDSRVESRIGDLKLVTPHYQHVEGTSFASPLIASVVACTLQANPTLRPQQVRHVLLAAAHPVPGAAPERQGAGALDAGQAVALALRQQHGPLAQRPALWALSPHVTADTVTYLLHDHHAKQVQLLGSWDVWSSPGLMAIEVEPGIWQARQELPSPGRYTYKFLIDGRLWLDDPSNPHKTPDGFGGLNSILVIDN